MTGINPENNLNDQQLQGLAGGEVLRKCILQAFRDRKAEDTPETTKRLTDTLTKNKLAVELLILIAQERQSCIFRIDSAESPLKVLGNLFDEIHIVLGQYLEVLRIGMPLEQFERNVPSVSKLTTEFGIKPEVAWMISRPAIKARMAKLETSDVEDVEMKDAAPAVAAESTPATKNPWDPVLEKIMEEIKPVLPEEVWAKLSPSFYVTFWHLSISDIFVPMDAYQTEINRNGAAVRVIDNDRSDPSVAGHHRRRAGRQELVQQTLDVSAELKLHIRDHNLTRKRLSAEKGYWFNTEKYHQRDTTVAFIQYCLLPRAQLSPNDASFCARFIKEIHKLGTPKFHTVGVYDNTFTKGLGTLIFTCTQREAENLGRFMKEMLSDLHSWHKDKNVYDREAHGKGLPGFHSGTGKIIDWEDFRKLLYKWHKALQVSLKLCLLSSEYMHIRNAIIILKNVFEYFPAVDWQGRNFIERIEIIAKSEKRQDLMIAARTLLGLLKKREKNWVATAMFQKVSKQRAAALDPR